MIDARTVARHASSVRSAIESRFSRRTLRTPVTRIASEHARVSGGTGVVGGGEPSSHADGAPSTSRYTGPLSDTTNSRPHTSSPNELSPCTVRPSAASDAGFARSTERSPVAQ